MVNHPNRSKRPRLTKTEWEAIYAALQFVLAGEDPWEGENAPEPGGDSARYLACRSALTKLDERG